MSITTRLTGQTRSGAAPSRELTRSLLLRYGMIIAVMVIVTVAIALRAVRSTGDDVTSTRQAGDAIATVDAMVADTLSVARSRFERAYAMSIGDDELVTRFSTEGAAAAAALRVDVDKAYEAAKAAPSDGLSAADSKALGAAGVAGTAVVALKDKADAYLKATEGFWTETDLGLSAQTYDSSLVPYFELRAAQDELDALLVKGEDAVGRASDRNSTRNEILVIVGALIALGGLVLVGRRAISSLAAMRALQTDIAESQQREQRLAAETHEREQQRAADDRERDQQQAAEVERQSLELQRKVDSLLATVAAAASGDLTARVNVTGEDAVGQMGTALEALLSMLRGSVAKIAANSETLAAAAEQLQVVSRQMDSNSAETSNQVTIVTAASIDVANNVESVAAASEQLVASIQEIAGSTASAARVAAEAVEAGRATNDTVRRLGDSSAEIDQIVKVITGIAQQTNLLALNATIEAARAGDAGKGFAVVANEVKELALETAKATEDISAKIEAIQADTHLSVESIGGMVTIIDQISEFQNTIASAVEEQAATTSEIARGVAAASGGSAGITANMHKVSSAADSTAAGASDSQNSAAELARMSAELKVLVGQFTY